MYQRFLGTFCEKDRAHAVSDTKHGVTDSFVHFNHVLATYFTVYKSTFVKRCLIGNLLSRFF